MSTYDASGVSKRVKIVMPKGQGPLAQGTRVFLDDVEETSIVGIHLELMPNSVAKLRLDYFAEVVFDGTAEVEKVHVCLECKSRLVKVANVTDGWAREELVAWRDEKGDVDDV